MGASTIIVEGFAATAADDTNLQSDVWSFALDQRAFGPRRLVVAFTDRAGNLLCLAHAQRTALPEVALACCVDWARRRPSVAVAFCDEPRRRGSTALRPRPAIRARPVDLRARDTSRRLDRM
jgi:hypothetical protein